MAKDTMINVAAIFISVFLAVVPAAWFLGGKVAANAQRIEAVQTDVNFIKSHFMTKGLNSSIEDATNLDEISTGPTT